MMQQKSIFLLVEADCGDYDSCPRDFRIIRFFFELEQAKKAFNAQLNKFKIKHGIKFYEDFKKEGLDRIYYFITEVSQNESKNVWFDSEENKAIAFQDIGFYVLETLPKKPKNIIQGFEIIPNGQILDRERRYKDSIKRLLDKIKQGVIETGKNPEEVMVLAIGNFENQYWIGTQLLGYSRTQSFTHPVYFFPKDFF